MEDETLLLFGFVPVFMSVFFACEYSFPPMNKNLL